MNSYDDRKNHAQYEIEAVNQALRDGFPPTSTTERTAAQAAADRLGADRRRFVPRVGSPDSPGRWDRDFNLNPDWSLYAPREHSVCENSPERAKVAYDPIAERRSADEIADLKAKLREAERRTIASEDIRGGIAGLFSDPPRPKPFPDVGRPYTSEGEIPLINLFDLQWGEVVDIDRMDGINSYNAEIAERRLTRFFDATIDLLTNHWKGPRPPKAYVALGGDLVSGQIHDELVKTNDRSAIEAVRDLVGLLIEGIERLAEALQCPIEVISLPGNHGRITKKCESKKYVVDSYDTLVAWLLELHFNKPGSDVTVTVPASGDALVTIYGRNILWTHGDRIGTRGGDGGAGVAAPASRGMRKIMAEYAARGIRVDTIIMGHWHTALELEDGFVSGPLVGWSEFARDCRFKPRPASQWLLTMHPVWGIAQRWLIFVGAEDEGTIYRAPQGALA